MLLLVMIGCVVIFMGHLIWLSHYYVRRVTAQAEQRMLKAQDFLQQVQSQKEKILDEKKNLETEAAEIFTLYEITREITKQPSEVEAFKVFETKLQEIISVEDCRFLSVESDEYEKIKSDKGYFVFTLKEKNRLHGYLALKGLSQKDKEKAMIMGHQFALALRRVKLYEEIEELSITDSLTEAHTRRYFLQRFEEELKRANSRNIKLAFLIIDVDHFKQTNDKYGHLVGDQILKVVASIIKENIREIDILGRYGGEELCVVLPDTDKEGARLAAERIRIAVEEAAIKAYDAVVKITISIGVSTCPENGKDVIELIDKADWALYRAKKRGRNCTCVFGVYR